MVTYPRMVRIPALLVAVSLLFSLNSAVPAARADSWKPELQKTPSTAVKRQATASAKNGAVERFKPGAVTWPAATDDQVDLRGVRAGQAVRAGRSPVSVAAPDGKVPSARVRVLDQAG